MRARLLTASLLLVVTSSLAPAQPRSTEVPLLVSTAWLGDHLRDPDIVVLYTAQRAGDDPVIAGARSVPHESLMTSQGGHDLASNGALVGALERAGVSNGSHVVVYGEPLAAGWLFFALDYLGHDRVSMLDGGIEKWKAEGRPVAAASLPTTPGSFKPTPRPRLRASADDVQTQMKGRVALLDARSSREYVDGHIPGAKLVSWQDVYADPKQQVFKSRQELVTLFQSAGVQPGGAAITYCQIGLRASALYFAARYAGLDVSNYVGSWSDWSSRALPVEK